MARQVLKADAWSEIANASDPEKEPEDAVDTSPLPAEEKKMKKRVVVRGNDEPQLTEALRTRRRVSELRPYTVD